MVLGQGTDIMLAERGGHTGPHAQLPGEPRRAAHSQRLLRRRCQEGPSHDAGEHTDEHQPHDDILRPGTGREGYGQRGFLWRGRTYNHFRLLDGGHHTPLAKRRKVRRCPAHGRGEETEGVLHTDPASGRGGTCLQRRTLLGPDVCERASGQTVCLPA